MLGDWQWIDNGQFVLLIWSHNRSTSNTLRSMGETKSGCNNADEQMAFAVNIVGILLCVIYVILIAYIDHKDMLSTMFQLLAVTEWRDFQNKYIISK